MLRAYLVDDEALALRRLARMLVETGCVEVAGSTTDPVEALAYLSGNSVDLLFLDIQMPEMTGFDLLTKLDPQPLTVFTTAYDRYALEAFRVNSIDYLLKPVEAHHLERTLQKIERIRGGAEPRPDFGALVHRLTEALKPAQPEYPSRLPSRSGDKVEFVELDQVTHFFAKDKLTYASTPSKTYVIDQTITELEQKLDPRQFLRIHRSTLVNVGQVHELYGWFGGRLLVRLKDGKRTELTVARDRVKALKEKMGL